MEKIASTAGFSIQTVSESTSTDIGTTTDSTSVQNPGQINPHYYTVSGTVRDYSSLKDALTRIESGLRLISVEKIDIQGGQSGSGLSVTITAKTYSRGE
jgi:hypothetical protein